MMIEQLIEPSINLSPLFEVIRPFVIPIKKLVNTNTIPYISFLFVWGDTHLE